MKQGKEEVVEEDEEEEEEVEEIGKGVPWAPRHFEFLLKVLNWNQLSLIHFINITAVDKFSHNCK